MNEQILYVYVCIIGVIISQYAAHLNFRFFTPDLKPLPQWIQAEHTDSVTISGSN